MTTLQWQRLAVLVLALAVLISGYEIVSAVTVSNSTGVLKVKTEPGATVTVSQENHQAEFLGKGSLAVRLAPGTYHLAADQSGRKGEATVVISKKQTTSRSLSLSDSSKIPTAQNISFRGSTDLVDAGLSSAQINQLQQEFFQFKSSAHEVVVDTYSIQPGPHNPGSGQPFTLNFNVTVDGTKYRAVASYNDLQNIRLYLYDASAPNQVQVFDSGPGVNVAG